MPFLSTSRSRKKKKSYLQDENSEESARRREMIKQKLYAQHMIEPDESGCDDYLERRLNSRSPVRRGIQRANSSRRVQTPNYIDPSGSLRETQDRKPPRRAHSEHSGRKLPGGTRTVPRRTYSDEHTPIESRFTMAPHPTMERPSRRMSSRFGSQQQSYDDEGEEGEMMLAPTSPVGQRRPPPRRRRAARSPRSVASIGTENSLDYHSDHSKSSKENSQKSFGRGAFRRRSLSTKQQMDTSDHTSGSQQSWFTNGSASVRSKEDIYNSALHRAKERQAFKNSQNKISNTGGNHSIATHDGIVVSLSEQLSQLPTANDDSDGNYDEDDEESPSIFGSIISKIESIYDSTIN